MHWLNSLYDRLSGLQEGRVYRITASFLIVLLVASAFGLVATGGGDFLPHAFRSNLLSGSIVALAFLLAIVWLGLSAPSVVLAAVAIPLVIGLRVADQPVTAQVVTGAGVMTLVFMTLLEVGRLCLSASSPSLAISRNLLDEAIRMKIALVFVGALVLLLPVLLTQLKPTEPLRYRLQTFLSYGIGMSYALLAMMTLFVATASVAFEQRDKQIYQIVSKPVSKIEYLLGKWVGVMVLNLILLAMIGGAVFWFAQYLRGQPAMDEYDALATSEQVLTARVGVNPSMPDARDKELWGQAFEAAKQEVESSTELDNSSESVYRLAMQNIARLRSAEMTLEPGGYKEYVFQNVHPLGSRQTSVARVGTAISLDDPVKSVYDVKIKSADGSRIYSLGSNFLITDGRTVEIQPAEIQKQSPQPMADGEPILIEYFPQNAMTLRFKLNASDNDPGIHFPMTFIFPDVPGFFDVQEVALVQTQTILVPAGAVREDGTLRLGVFNGDAIAEVAAPYVVTFPPDGLEIMYKVASFESNYARAMLVTWLKLGFLAMLGIAAATFASFPVACLVAFTVFLGAESAPYLADSLEYYRIKDIATDEIIMWKAIVSGLGKAVYWLFNAYGNIRPSDNLIEGRLIQWSVVLRTLGVITGVWTGTSLLVGWTVFRSRQLAIYSGHQ